MQLLRMIQFFMVWGTGNTSPRAQEVRSPSYVCSMMLLAFFLLSFFFFF